MKAIINCCAPKQSWSKEFFEDVSPFMLPVVGKPLIEFYLDYCSLSGIDEILIAYDDFNDELSEFLSNDTRWGIKVTGAPVAADSTRSEILLRYANFANEDIIFIEGLFFPLYDKSGRKHALPSIENKHITLAGNGDKKDIFCECTEIEIPSLDSYFKLNMEILEKYSQRLIMKGYSAEKDVFMGMNDVIMRGVDLIPPFIIGDNVQIEIATQIGRNAIIGDTCIIDRRSHIENSIIFDKTYVGADLDLREKILFNNKIIDPKNEICVSFADNFFISKVSERSIKKSLWRLMEIFGAAVIFAYLLPIYLGFSIVGKPRRLRIPFSYSEHKKKKYYCTTYIRTAKAKNVWFFKLSADKFTLLKHVFSGKLSLIGDTPRDIIKDESLVLRHRRYTPGVFTYADSLGHTDSYESLIDDLFYKHNRTFKGDLQLILRTFVSRLLTGIKKNNAE